MIHPHSFHEKALIPLTENESLFIMSAGSLRRDSLES
jgi:hypothetical protein